MKLRKIDILWQQIFDQYHISKHPFQNKPFLIAISEIKRFLPNNPQKAYILCKQDTRESRPLVFQENDLFILPVKNGHYAIIRGKGYVDLPEITQATQIYRSKLTFTPVTSAVGNSEMQHLDFAYAASLIRTFLDDTSLVLTIRGRKYTPKFSFRVGTQEISVQSVQTEVDAGYEGVNKIVLVEAKNGRATNTIIRQLYYPYRQWTEQVNDAKPVSTIFFEKTGNEYSLWQFEFTEKDNYNAIRLVRSSKFQIR